MGRLTMFRQAQGFSYGVIAAQCIHGKYTQELSDVENAFGREMVTLFMCREQRCRALQSVRWMTNGGPPQWSAPTLS
jgi:hypothetical protein